ncbi:hypothetical protein MMC07_009346 [Pseudocyphellaria aurata]|nr:hypothetical protein [Pseudocyphellaria aurata]
MDIILGKVTNYATNYAIKSGVAITASFAIKQSSRLLKTVEGNDKEELQDLQERLDGKIRIISPAIDMIELISARGNTSLESAVSLTKSLRWEIQTLGQRLASAVNAEESTRRGGSQAQAKAQNALELKKIIQAIRKLLNRIEDAVPLINLAITASGANLSSSLPTTVSPSRLLQASTFLTAGDTQYSMSTSAFVQIGPTFVLSMYMLFTGHVRPRNEEDIRENTWKEVIHKAVVKLVRVSINNLYNMPGTKEQDANGADQTDQGNQTEGHFPRHLEAEAKGDEYAYQLVIVEDFEDDRLHTFEESETQPGPYGDIAVAGIREAIPVHEISKIFYADTGKILNIGNDGETNSPVLLLKRDVNAIAPRRMMESYGEDASQQYDGRNLAGGYRSAETYRDDELESQHGGSEPLHGSIISSQALQTPPDPWRLPQNLDPEWIALEVYTGSVDSDGESETEIETSTRPGGSSRSSSIDPRLNSALSRLRIRSASTTPAPSSPFPQKPPPLFRPALPPIRTSLSLLETILRLLSLQQFQQTSHLSIPDELLTFFLSESASTGASTSDSQERKRLRNEARQRVGFDPYDESPVKRRGEEYQYKGGDEQYVAEDRQSAYEGYEGFSPIDERYGTPIRYNSHDEGYATHNWSPSQPRRPQPLVSEQRGTPQPPQTPPLLLRSSSHQSPRSEGAPPMRGQLGGRREMSLRESGDAKRSSPLARPGTGLTDEGLGSSPSSQPVSVSSPTERDSPVAK